MSSVRLLAVALLLLSCTRDRAQGEPARAVSSEAAPLSQSATPASPETGTAESATCANYAECAAVGRIESDALTEISGIAASRSHEGVLYVHNDSGDDPRFFAIDRQGQTLGEFALPLNRFRDIEDIAVGPGPDGKSHVYLADTGDNAARTGFGAARSETRVYRVPEPPLPEDPSTKITLPKVDVMVLTYPHSPHDAETLMIDPVSGDLFLLSKENDGRSLLFRAAAPLEADKARTLERVGILEFGRGALSGNPMATGGDIAPNGAAVLIRTYSHVFEWRRESGTTVADALGGVPRSLPLSSEPQGEAVCYARDSRGYFTTSELGHQPLYFCGCR